MALVRKKEPRSAVRRLQVRPLWALSAIMLTLIAWAWASLQRPYPYPLRPNSERSILEVISYPIEVNASRRVAVTPENIMDFTVLSDGAHGWAVGGNGTILATKDGGKSWNVQPCNTLGPLTSVAFNDDGQRGWAVGWDGTIFATSDAGQSWTAQTSGTTSDLLVVQFNTDGLRGWAVGWWGTILSTRNGGQSWTEQISGTQADLQAVQFVADGLRGWAVGGSGTILVTRDGGQSWAEQTSNTNSDLQSVQFNADGLRGWAVGDNGTILATRDGGENWTVQSSSTQADLQAVQFNADGLRGWAVGDNGTILTTRNSGQIWTPLLSNGAQTDLQAVQLNADGQPGWVMSRNGTILATRDGGQNWTPLLNSDSQIDLSSMAFNADGQPGWVVGSSGTILATRDGGKNWVEQTSGTKTHLQAVQFNADGQRGWAVGNSGTILATQDGGQKWTPQTSGTNSDLQAVQFNADGLRGWAVGDNGTILTTRDSGKTWILQANGTKDIWSSVVFNADGQRGWVVGYSGTILITQDGGQRWTPQTSATDAHLKSVQFNADGLRGWAVGHRGTILATRDGGKNWIEQTSGTKADLQAVQFDTDGQRGWAVGDSGTILTSRDGGSNWKPVVIANVDSGRLGVWITDAQANSVWIVGHLPVLLHTTDGGKSWETEIWPLHYSRYPAPWFWLALASAVLCWWRALQLKTIPDEQGAEAFVSTDAPVAQLSQDRLRFGPLAMGISRFLRNDSTEPPLTIAVSGEWGSGKSSLMGMVCSDLRRRGSSTVWFNAWHHQKDEQLLAALLNAVCSRGLPSLITPEGWVFRLRLLWLRSKKHFILAFLVVALLAGMGGLVAVRGSTAWQNLWSMDAGHTLLWLKTVASGNIGNIKIGDLGTLLGQISSLAALVVALRKALTAFGADPAVLLSGTVDKFRLNDASALTGFRTRFAREFDEVTHCLPYRMVIVIDDLDRCRPEAVLEVMEAVNFLVSSGSCFVLFGMAPDPVQAALAVSFEKIAAEMEGPVTGERGARTGAEKEQREYERRHNYARNYLEKLINLEIAVPITSARTAQSLVDTSDSGRSRKSGTTGQKLIRSWPLVLLALAVTLGWHVGATWSISDPLSQPGQKTGGQVQVQVSQPINLGQNFEPTQFVTPALPSLYSVSTVQQSEDHPIAWPIITLPIVFLVAWALCFGLVRLRMQVHQVKDSLAFLQALKIWMPVVQQHRRTPRAIKRFANRIRYLAMLQQPEHLDKSGLDQVAKQVRSLWKKLQRGTSHEETSVADNLVQSDDLPVTLSEDIIVALGALHEVCGKDWRNCVVGHAPSAIKTTVEKAIEQHRAMGLGANWPPTDAEMDSFERALRGIRIPA